MIKKSFLLCFHDGYVNVYQNGVPVGVVRDGRFEVHRDGTNTPVRVDYETMTEVVSTVGVVQAWNAPAQK
jgi:hypothetical protein